MFLNYFYTLVCKSLFGIVLLIQGGCNNYFRKGYTCIKLNNNITNKNIVYVMILTHCIVKLITYKM